MVFASYNSASYLLPLDNDQSVTFYRNENRLFPAAIGPSSVAGGGGGSAPPPGRNNHSNTTTTDMLTAAYHHEMQQQHLQTAGGGAGGGASGGGNMIAGDCPFGRVQSPVTQQQQQQFATQHHPRFGGAVAMCEDFQPVGYLNGSSNGYYGFVPSLASQDANGTGSGGGDGGGRRSVTSEISDNNNRHHHLPATTPNVNGHHVPAIHFHGNHHRISCAVDEQNNNNNADDGGNTPEGFYHLQPFPLMPGGGQFPRKRKEANLLPDRLHDDEEMEVSSGQHHPKRRKTEPEAMLYPLLSNNSEEPLPPGRYLHQVEIHHSAVDEMECQDQQLTDETDQQQQQQPAGHDGQPAASKSKYFDTNRCMMSHMI